MVGGDYSVPSHLMKINNQLQRNGQPLHGDRPTEQRFCGTNSDTINISNEVVKKFSSHMGEPGNDARK